MRPVFPALWPSARGIWALLALCVLAAFAGAVPHGLALLAVAGAALAVLFAADLALGNGAGLELERLPVGFIALRRQGRLRYALTNRGASRLHVGLVESPVALLALDRDELRATVEPRARLEIAQGFTPLERGDVRFDSIYCWVENAVGVVRRRVAFDAPAEATVFPDLSAVEGRGTLGRRRSSLEAGLRKLRARGVGTEFESLREYAAGDAFRSVDWKATARRGRMMVTQHEVERSQQVIVALDAGRLMYPRVGAQRKFDYALGAGLSVAHVAERAGDAVGLIAFAARPLLEVAPRRGRAHYGRLVRASCALQPAFEEPDYEAVVARIAARNPKRSLILAFTDLFDPVASSAVLKSFARLVPRHLVVCALMNDAALERTLDREPKTVQEAYRGAVALTLAEERREAIAVLRSSGVIVVDAPADALAVSLLDTYLEVKARTLL